MKKKIRDLRLKEKDLEESCQKDLLKSVVWLIDWWLKKVLMIDWKYQRKINLGKNKFREK